MSAGGRSRSLAAWRRRALQRMRSSRAATLGLVARLPPAEMLRPRTIDRWSVKDVLGHLSACDEETTRRFRLIARGRGRDIHWFETMADADRFNARTVARARRLGLPAVRRRLVRARADMVRAFQRLPLADLRDPSHAYPVVEWLPAPGWSHEAEHAAEIRAWWRSLGRPPARSGRPRRP